MAGMTGINMLCAGLPYLDYNRMWHLPFCHAVFLGVFKRFMSLLYPPTAKAKAQAKARATTAAAAAAAATAAATATSSAVAQTSSVVSRGAQSALGVQPMPAEVLVAVVAELTLVAGVQPATNVAQTGLAAVLAVGVVPAVTAAQPGVRSKLRATAPPFVPKVQQEFSPEMGFSKDSLKSIKERSSNMVRMGSGSLFTI